MSDAAHSPHPPCSARSGAHPAAVESVIARPGARRQLDAPGLWIFWRDATDGRGRQGFACRPLACGQPGCECSELVLDGVLIDGRVERVEAKRGSLDVLRRQDLLSAAERAHDLLPARATVLIDFATGEVAPDVDGGPRSAEVAAWLASDVDDELLAHLHAAWLMVQGPHRRTRQAEALRRWRPGLLLEHGAAFPDERWDVVVDGRVRYRVDEAFCPEPACPCKRVYVWFDREDDDAAGDGGSASNAAPGGCVRLELPSLEPLEVEARGIAEADVLRLWALRRARHPDLLQAMLQRQRRMKTFRPPAPKPLVRTKVGRNDPCPCGSGRKFKRCCEGANVGRETLPRARAVGSPGDIGVVAPAQDAEQDHSRS